MQWTPLTPHLGPLEARQTVTLASHVITHRTVVAVAAPLAVHVVCAGGAGVGAHLALVTQGAHSVTVTLSLCDKCDTRGHQATLTVQPMGQWQIPVTGWQLPWF